MIISKNFKEIKKSIEYRVKKEDDKFPDVILIDTISYCNLKCSMCPHKEMGRKNGIMSWELYKKIIDEIAEKKPESRIWITFFGEGLILEDLSEKIQYGKEKGLEDIVLNSNGNLLDYDKSVSLIKAGLDGLYVGVDAFTEENYLKFRVGGNLQKVVDGVLSYKKALEEYGKPEQELYVQFVVMDENENELEEFLEFWKSHGIQVKVRPKVSWGGKMEATNLIETEERIPCNWGMNTINIADTGTVCLCSVDLECEVPMGDINKNTIEEVWNGSLKEFRNIQRESNWEQLPKKCRECKDWQSSYAKYV